MRNNDFKRTDLENMICEVMGIQSITPMIAKQINRYILDFDMSFKEIARCVVWYAEVYGGTFNTVYGIGIVPNVREQAAAYFKKLELDQQQQAIEAKKVVEYQDNNIIFHIKQLKHNKRKPKHLDITDIDVTTGDVKND